MGWTLVLKNSKLSGGVCLELEAADSAGGAIRLAPEYKLLVVAPQNTSSSVALLVPVILTHPRCVVSKSCSVSVLFVPVFKFGIALKQGSKLSDVFHGIECKHALDQTRACCHAKNGCHQLARLRHHLVASHRILGSATHMLHTLCEARAVG